MLPLLIWVGGWQKINTSGDYFLATNNHLGILRRTRAFMKKYQLMNRVIDYALCHLNSNWDDWIEDDLGISNEQFQKLIEFFQKSLDEKQTNH